MKTKNIFKYFVMGLVCCGLAATLTACSDDDPYFAAGEDDAPRILNTDIPEGESGEPGIIATIDRTMNFTFDVIVTPARYTTVKWYIDDEEVGEGITIDVPVLAGDHILKIVATTTKGASTSRTCKLVVRPVDGDPELASDAKSRWLTIGTTKTIDCNNVDGVAKLFIGKQEVSNLSYANGKLTFDVPDMTEGDYPVTIQLPDGSRYGCGNVTVSKDAYVDPGIKETVLWEGDVVINWGDSNVQLSAADMASVPVGATISLEYEFIEGSEYYAMRITNSSWEKDLVEQFDLNGIPSPFEFVYTQAQKAIVDENNMLIVGFGYRLKKVVAIEGVAPAETTLWEGEHSVTWDNPFKGLQYELVNHVQPGTILRAYVSGEGQGCAATAWWRNLVTGYSDDDEGRGDTPISGDMVLEYELNELSIKLLNEQDGFFMVGNGYVLKKITVG